MKMKFSMRSIPAAAAMTAALVFGAQVQAQTATPPTTATGDKAAIPSGPNTGAKTAEQRDAAKPMAKPGMDAGATATGGSANIPAGPNTTGKTMEQRDAAKPMAKKGMDAAAGGTGAHAATPAGPNTTSKTMEQRDASKPMARQGAMATEGGPPNTSLATGGGGDQPVRQSGKVAKNKSERMAKGDKQKSSMGKSNEPVRESDLKEEKK
jgi:hypothetical protein